MYLKSKIVDMDYESTFITTISTYALFFIKKFVGN